MRLPLLWPSSQAQGDRVAVRRVPVGLQVSPLRLVFARLDVGAFERVLAGQRPNKNSFLVIGEQATPLTARDLPELFAGTKQ